MDESGVRKVLERKLQVYKRDGNAAAAGNVQQILDAGLMAVKATTPVIFAKPQGSGRKMRLRETPTAEELRNEKRNTKRTSAQVNAIMMRMAEDPVYAAEVELDMRKPRKVDRAKYHIASRAACREPMLNAAPESITNGLKYRELDPKDKTIKAGVYSIIIVKPLSLKVAKSDGPAFWGERRWQVFTLKYANGYVVVTDKGKESKVFPTYGELRSAIIGSGWEVVR